MIQLLYISTRAARCGTDGLASILAESRRNNVRRDVTGMLLFNGRRFLQAMEGPRDAVDQIFRRIQADQRHIAIVELSRRRVVSREFGDWAMAHDEGGAAGRAAFLQRVDRLTANASPTTRSHFMSYAVLPVA